MKTDFRLINWFLFMFVGVYDLESCIIVVRKVIKQNDDIDVFDLLLCWTDDIFLLYKKNEETSFFFRR